MQLKKQKAFSLIEISIVILIVGIIISGVVGGSLLVKKSKIVTAQSATQLSPIKAIPDTALWLESSLEDSFKNSETSSGDAVSVWYDQKNSVNKSSVVAVGNGPTYSNTINYIHAVKFSGSSSDYLQISDASFLNNSDYTIVILEKRQSATAGYFIGNSAVATSNQTLVLGYSADQQITHSQGSDNSYNSAISSYSSSTDNPRIFTFTSDSTQGKKTYINGLLAAQSADTTQLSGITTLAIGKGYTGEIGEVAIFTRALKSDERKYTEDYLGKKFAAKVNRNTIASGSCVGGVITNNGCAMDCVTSAIAGLTSPSVVSDGASNVTGTCGGTGYAAGTVTLSCSNGSLTSTPSTGCACDTGYISGSGGSCVSPSNCTVSVVGVTTPASVNHGTSGNLTCGATGYTGTVAYTCNNGSLNLTGSCACVTGYAGSTCSTCDTGYVAGGGGTCVPVTCTIDAASGFAAKTGLAYASTATTISSPCQIGYTGSPTYTCTASGDATVSGTCNAITCTAEAGTGYDAKTGLAYAASGTGSFSCDASGYAGTKNYTCTATGAATITGGTCDRIWWTLMSTTAKGGSDLFGSRLATSPIACSSSYKGRYVLIRSTYTVTFSGSSLSATSAYGWLTSFCSSDNCGDVVNILGGGYYNVYRCDP
jgi:prepilin-type N-terminal cleavage/methylation domain-containing protein